MMHPLPAFRHLLLLALLTGLIQPALSLPEETVSTYSFVHISDLQSLTTNYPATLNLTFSHIESRKTSWNISAIIITGDVVNTWDSENDWNAFSRARNLTTVPIYQVAGNHDTGGGNNYRFYTSRTGMPAENTLTFLEDFDVIGINYAGASCDPGEFSRMRQFLENSSRTHAIIAAHYYMNEDGTLSPLGNDTDTFLIIKPTLVLMGHMHNNFIRQRIVGGFPVIAEMTNYQDGVPGGTTGWDYSAGTLYTVTSVNGQVTVITARVMHIYPTQSLEEEQVVYPPQKAGAVLTGSSGMAVVPVPAQPIAPCTGGDVSCSLLVVLQQAWTDFWPVR